MKAQKLPSLLFLLLTISFAAAASYYPHENFLQCLSLHNSYGSNSISKLIYTPNNSSYSSVLLSSVRNLRLATPTTPKPLVIVTPLKESQIQAAINCSKQHGMQIRVRSGGHDYEGLSYVSYQAPFIIIDLKNLDSISVDVENKTAWVQVGASLGQLYYRIAEKSKTLAFPSGVCPTVGVGGHFSGGGYGMISRKHGMAVDNIIDAQLIDVNGRILNRQSMGEDLFWAIRGGGSASFGVILSWKIKLVSVPEIVTVFTVNRTLEQNASNLIQKWQYVADKIDNNLLIKLSITGANSNDTEAGNKTVQAFFDSLFLGGVDELLSLMQKSFPELGLVRSDCIQMSWIESVLYFAGYSGQSSDILLNRTSEWELYFKGKSDYVTQPISDKGLKVMYKMLTDGEAELADVQFTPYGGKINEVLESETAFPHRAGTIYGIYYVVAWAEEGIEIQNKQMRWIRRFHKYMTPYVSKAPRAAYINYRDLDLGTNNNVGNTSYAQASVWGLKYFKSNFDKLVRVKTAVDPSNFFRNEQSIPVV